MYQTFRWTLTYKVNLSPLESFFLNQFSAVKSFVFEHTRWRLFQERTLCIKLHIYIVMVCLLKRCKLVLSRFRNCLPFRSTCVHPRFLWGSCYSIFSFICMFCRSLFVLLFFFFWPLCCLFFFDIRILTTPLVSFGHCVVCSSSIYGFWLPPFGIYKLFFFFQNRYLHQIIKWKTKYHIVGTVPKSNRFIF